MTLELPITSHLVENYIKEHKKDVDLFNQLNEFLETQLIIRDIKSGLDEVELYKEGKIELKDVEEFLKELDSENKSNI